MGEDLFIFMIFLDKHTLSVSCFAITNGNYIEINVSFNLLHPESVHLVQKQYKCLNESLHDVEHMFTITTFELVLNLLWRFHERLRPCLKMANNENE